MKCFNTVILEISINNALKKYIEGFWNNMLSPNFHRIFHLNSFVLLIAGIYKPTSSHYQKSHLEVYVINTIWKAQKDQENFIFPSTFWLNKNRISHHRKVQNKKFSVTSKYHLSINFFTQKNPRISHHRKVQNKNFSVISKYHISINLLAKKKHVFYFQTIQNKNLLVISKHENPC